MPPRRPSTARSAGARATEPGAGARASEPGAGALVSVALLIGRWTERLLSGHTPPLTVSQFLALLAIESEPVSGSELARRAGVSAPAVSQLLTGLTENGLIERSELAADRRRRELRLSARGARALSSVEALLNERFAPLLDELPPHEVDALGRALSQIQATLSGTSPPRRPRPPRPHRSAGGRRAS